VTPTAPVQPEHAPQPLSIVPSQSSSTPLQLSVGGVQLPNVQLAPHVRVPVLPQVVMQFCTAP
jgi:hypothetical protein